MRRLLFAALLLSTNVVLAADQQPLKLSGWISDSKCAPRHTSSAPSPECVKKCIEGGAKPVFVDEAEKTVWSIDNPDAVLSHYGQHVSVTAVKDQEAKSIHISNVAKLSEPESGHSH